jgi:hypothetical protein
MVREREPTVIETLLFAAARIQTLNQGSTLTNATGFFFERDDRLYLVSSRHVFIDEPSQHFPDAVQIELHTSAENAAQTVYFSIPLYRDGVSLWHQGFDDGGEIDVALIELDRHLLPQPCVLHAFSPAHLPGPSNDHPEVGESLLIQAIRWAFPTPCMRSRLCDMRSLPRPMGCAFRGRVIFSPTRAHIAAAVAHLC